jgi:hypothetical protein
MEFVGNVQLVAGNAGSLEGIFAMLKESGIDPLGNPDVYVREYRSFGVDEARELILRAGSRAVSDARRVFIIVSPGMTNEAQNGLLKTLEEPSGDALFFIVVPSTLTLLPTLRSRAQTLVLDSQRSESILDPQAFLKASAAERVELLKPLLEKDSDDKRDVGEGIGFLIALEKALALHIAKNKTGIEAVYRARKYLGDKGSLAKALLEQVALLVG